MPRGKHGQRAETRQAIATRDQEIQTYQHAVARLTAERNDARQQLADMQRIHAAEVRELRARLREGLSPELEALRRTNSKLRWECDNRRRVTTQLGIQQDRLAVLLSRLLSESGLNAVEAADRVAELCPLFQSPKHKDLFLGSFEDDGPNATTHGEEYRRAYVLNLLNVARAKASNQLWARAVRGEKEAIDELVLLAQSEKKILRVPS